MAQPVETATDHRHNTQIPWTDNGLNVYGFVCHASSMLNLAKPSSYYRPLHAST